MVAFVVFRLDLEPRIMIRRPWVGILLSCRQRSRWAGGGRLRVLAHL